MEGLDVFGEEGQGFFGMMVSGESVFYFVICSVAAPPRDFAVEEGGVVGIVQGGVLGLEVRDGFWQVT